MKAKGRLEYSKGKRRESGSEVAHIGSNEGGSGKVGEQDFLLLEGER